jgi:hypothetical protein
LSTVAWREGKRLEVIRESLLGLENRRRADPGFSLKDAEGVLAHLYIRQGNDQEGRGELQDLILASTIDAYEEFIERWKAAASGA